MIDLLRCPVDGSELDKTLTCQHGHRFPSDGGIPRLLPDQAVTGTQTAASFATKWETVRHEDKGVLADFQLDWYDRRYGWGDEQGLIDGLAGAGTILDAGCGLGYDAARYARLAPHAQVVAFDLTDGVAIAQRDHGHAPNLQFAQADILAPPFRSRSFDFVVSDQVIHHTTDTARAFGALADLVAPGGQFAVYVYRQKGLIRELADDHIRALTTQMSADECLEFCKDVTELGKALSDVGATVTLERGVPLLGIAPGTHDVQRLVYWHMLKCFWNEDLGEHQSVMGNFDWYHPAHASRHTVAELKGWCAAAGLDVVHIDEIESGISLRATRR